MDTEGDLNGECHVGRLDEREADVGTLALMASAEYKRQWALLYRCGPGRLACIYTANATN